jgi:hypothetical protein
MREAITCGSGVAGLSAAIALAKNGWSVEVHERDGAVREIGAGIFVKANALRVIASFELLDRIRRDCVILREVRTLDKAGKDLCAAVVTPGSAFPAPSNSNAIDGRPTPSSATPSAPSDVGRKEARCVSPAPRVNSIIGDRQGSGGAGVRLSSASASRSRIQRQGLAMPASSGDILVRPAACSIQASACTVGHTFFCASSP